jgi:hypothetical protein
MAVTVFRRAPRWFSPRLRHQQLDLRPARTHVSQHLVREVLHQNATMFRLDLTVLGRPPVFCVPIEAGRVEETQACEFGVGCEIGLYAD